MSLRVGRLPPGSPALSTHSLHNSYIHHTNHNFLYNILYIVPYQ